MKPIHTVLFDNFSWTSCYGNILGVEIFVNCGISTYCNIVSYPDVTKYGRMGKSPWISPPCHLTKYLSATEHEEGQVIDPMHLRS